MNKILRLLLPLAILLPIVLGCSDFIKKVEESRKPSTIVSSDKQVSLVVPGGWRERDDLNKDAVIEAGSEARDVYVVVLKEERTDVLEDFTLADFAEWAADDMKENLQQSTVTGTTPITIGNLQAHQFEATGTTKDVKLKYLVAAIETEKNFYRIVVWTGVADFDNRRKEMGEVINGFKENASGPPVENTTKAPAR